MKNDVTIRPATEEDISLFFEEKSLPYTVRAWVGEYKKEPVVIAGVFLQEINAVAFSSMRKTDIPKTAIMRGARMLMEKINSLELPVTAATECSGKFLSKLGFKQADTEGHLWLIQ